MRAQCCRFTLKLNQDLPVWQGQAKGNENPWCNSTESCAMFGYLIIPKCGMPSHPVPPRPHPPTEIISLAATRCLPRLRKFPCQYSINFAQHIGWRLKKKYIGLSKAVKAARQWWLSHNENQSNYSGLLKLFSLPYVIALVLLHIYYWLKSCWEGAQTRLTQTWAGWEGTADNPFTAPPNHINPSKSNRTWKKNEEKWEKQRITRGRRGSWRWNANRLTLLSARGTQKVMAQPALFYHR